MDNVRIQSVLSSGGRVITARILPGTDLITGIEQICRDNNISNGAIVSAIGSLSKVRYVYVKPDESAKLGIYYGEPTELDGAVELLSGQGMIGTTDNGEMSVHFHGLMVRTDSGIIGGHFVKGGNPVLATIEVTIVEFKGLDLKRRFDEETGFPLFNFIQSA